MTALILDGHDDRARLGVKGPRAAEWLVAHEIVVPTAPNSWVHSATVGDSAALLVARLGSTEFFLEEAAGGTVLSELSSTFSGYPSGIYPVLREDTAFQLSGDGVHDVLAQVCNVNFAALDLNSHPVIMTLMIGVAVLVLPEDAGTGRRYRIWCDPTFGPYLGNSLETVVLDCGGSCRGASG